MIYICNINTCVGCHDLPSLSPKLRFFARSGPPFVIRSIFLGLGCRGLQVADLNERKNGVWVEERGDRANTEYCTFRATWVISCLKPRSKYYLARFPCNYPELACLILLTIFFLSVFSTQILESRWPFSPSCGGWWLAWREARCWPRRGLSRSSTVFSVSSERRLQEMIAF